MTNAALQAAREQLQQLIEAARAGRIIPVRLTGQLESVAALLEEADQAQSAPPSPADLPEDVAALIAENTEFLKVAVHELRIPMTSIRGYSDMLSNPAMVGELTEMQAQLLQVVRANARRMETLLAEMSILNKLRGNAVRVNAKMDMPKNILLMVEKATRPIAQELNRQLEFDVPQGLPMLMTDGELCRDMLVKVIENGLRYSPEGEGRVRVSAAPEGSKVIFRVEDNGIGITPDEMAQLGTLYFRGDNDVVRAYKGSGLGIPIAYGLASLLDGSVQVESEPGHGTRCTFVFQGMA